MHRWVALLALAACDPTAPVGDREPPPVRWLYPPAAGAFPLGELRGRIGRSQAPQPMLELGIAAPEGAPELSPLRLATAWPVPGDGPARAIVHGSEGDHPAIELIDLDRGRVEWRDTELCAAPIVGATRDVIVCADSAGTRAIGVDGKPRWRTAAPFIAFTDDRVVVSTAGLSIVLDAATGHELARIQPPAGVSPDAVIASCGDAGRELYTAGQDGRLVRIIDAPGGPRIAWAVPFGELGDVDACDGASVLVSQAGPAGGSLIALARATGKLTGRIDGVRGVWPARDGSGRVEVATERGVALHDRALVTPPVALGLAGLGELIASRGDRRLVRATPLTAVLLDRAGVRAHLPFGASGAVLGETSLVATTWVGSPGETLHRFGLPPRLARALRISPARTGIRVDAELRDLPPVQPLAAAAAVALPDAGLFAVPAGVIDPGDGAALYAIALNGPGERAAVARADLAGKRWLWQRADGCGPGTPVALAVARAVVVCGTQGTPSMVRATSRDGAARWEWIAQSVDTVIAGGEVVAVYDADRLTVLDARDGRVRGRISSDDVAAPRAAIVELEATTLIVTVERGRVVARLGAGGLLPLWSVAVSGVVRTLAPSGEGVLVTLEDGDAYRIDARTAAVVALPGVGLTWHAAGDVVTGHTVGGPIPAPAPPIPPPTPAQLLRRPLQILKVQVEVPPPMSTPIQPPPPLGDSWQLTIYELAGGLRARSDYALPGPVSSPAPRGSAGSPLVIPYGPGLQEVVVLDPRTGAPVRRVRLPDGAVPAAVFGTVVAGAPVAGTLLGSPLRVVLF